MNRDTREQHEADEAPIAGLRDLDFSAQPSRDLWPGIATRLAPRRRRLGANGWMSLAAAACVVAIVGLAVVPAPPSGDAAPHAQLAGIDQAFAAPDLRVVAGSRALVKANLQLSRNSEAQIRRALEQDPDSSSLRHLLLTTESRSDQLHHMLLAQAT
ncbi:hypothetical protein [Solimonas terrae]|uniref:Uncharacterized protein n=1 Tax=Solimonas terrae TaxID=1396819 RepID=A0A6M2BVU1_9GAMM|nr:hypothetical protein [Solimonas terrae]NGY06762.1 hypothetical protein [Solimonas terrae]